MILAPKGSGEKLAPQPNATTHTGYPSRASSLGFPTGGFCSPSSASSYHHLPTLSPLGRGSKKNTLKHDLYLFFVSVPGVWFVQLEEKEDKVERKRKKEKKRKRKRKEKKMKRKRKRQQQPAIAGAAECLPFSAVSSPSHSVPLPVVKPLQQPITWIFSRALSPRPGR